MIPGRRARNYIRTALRWLLVYQALAGFALVIVLATVAVPQTAHSRSEARGLAYGYPLDFLHVNVSTYTPPSYPQTYRYDPWEDVADMRGERFVLDVVLVTFVLGAPIWLIRRRAS